MGLHRFFFMHFYNDSLGNMESLEEAVQIYLKEGLDPQGTLLLKETNELLAKDMSDNELSSLIEDEWDVLMQSVKKKACI